MSAHFWPALAPVLDVLALSQGRKEGFPPVEELLKLGSGSPVLLEALCKQWIGLSLSQLREAAFLTPQRQQLAGAAGQLSLFGGPPPKAAEAPAPGPYLIDPTDEPRVEWHQIIHTWLGPAYVEATQLGIFRIDFSSLSDPEQATEALAMRLFTGDSPEEPNPHIERLTAWLETPQAPAPAIPIDIAGGTDFQHKVWRALLAVPHGEVTTYERLAAGLKLPAGASRALGTAVGSNPVAMLIPCHRVLRKNGALSGFRWGVARKLALLIAEAQEPPRKPQPKPVISPWTGVTEQEADRL